MKALLLGCGEMGETALRDLYAYGNFDEITVGTRNLPKAERLLRSLHGKKVDLRAVACDVSASAPLADLMRHADVVVNCVGPNYKYELPIARAAIAAGVHLVDLNDEYEITPQMYALDEEAHSAGVTIIFGLGASPGVNNILVKAAANRLDEVNAIHTAWVMSAADPGGLALSYHLLYSLSGRALTYSDNRWHEVRSFVDGKERIEFPAPVGPLDVYHIGHPEPITLSRTYPQAAYVDDKATFNPPRINDLIVGLGALVREAQGPIQVDGRAVDPMDFAAAYLYQECKRVTDVPTDGALRVEVTGTKRGRQESVVFSSVGRLAQGTGIPAAVGAMMICRGDITRRGAMAPEDCVDPNDFLYEMLNRRQVAKLNGWMSD